MLEKLNDVNWKEIKGAVGSAERIPDLVRGIISYDMKLQEKSFEILQEFINHQGSIYEATSYTIPFLFELLPLDIGNSQRLITELLLNFVTAPDYWNQMDSIKLEPYDKFVDDALIDGFDVLFALIGNGQKQAQMDAIHILIFICVMQNEKIPQAVTRLKQLIKRSDTDDAIRATAIYDFGRLYEAMEDKMQSEKLQLIDLFKQHWQATKVSPTSFAASLSLCRFMESDLPREIEDYLIKAIVQPIWKSNLLQEGIYIGEQIVDGAGGMENSAVVALWNLGLERSIVAIGKAVSLVNVPKRARKLSIILLDWVFYRDILSRRTRIARSGIYPQSSESLDVSKLKKYHKQALLAVIDSESVWKEPTNFLEMYGLPADRDEVRTLLGQSDREKE